MTLGSAGKGVSAWGPRGEALRAGTSAGGDGVTVSQAEAQPPNVVALKRNESKYEAIRRVKHRLVRLMAPV